MEKRPDHFCKNEISKIIYFLKICDVARDGEEKGQELGPSVLALDDSASRKSIFGDEKSCHRWNQSFVFGKYL